MHQIKISKIYITHEESGNDESGCWTIHVEQLSDNDIADNATKSGSHHGNGDTGSAQIRGEDLGYEAVEGCVTAADDAAEDRRDYHILILVAHKVQPDRARA